ncbi:MAG: flagellar protein FlaG [Candidatus Hydrogenedentes bacterium]|nr:flagellar protein FlaG [Candidatus Hydrogenedentota bacterium]
MGIRSVTGPVLKALGAPAARTPAPRPLAADAAPPGASSAPGIAPTARASPELNTKVQRTNNTIEIVLNERTGTRLRIDKATKRIVAQIVGRDNNIIKQIPPEEALEIAARLREFRGEFFDESV